MKRKPRGELIVATGLLLAMAVGRGAALTLPEAKPAPGDKSTAAPRPPPSDLRPMPKVLAVATGVEEPVVVTWVDHEDESVSLDTTMPRKIQAMLAGASWLMFDTGDLVIGRWKDEGFEPIFIAQHTRDKEATLFIFHMRAKALGEKGRTLYVNGTVRRSPIEPTQGGANLYIVELQKEGKVAANSYVLQLLRFSQKLTARQGRDVERAVRSGLLTSQTVRSVSPRSPEPIPPKPGG